MTTVKILFYIFSLITVLAAFSVINAKNPVRAVLSLVVAFVGAACVWMLMEVEFLALVLIVVYVGAVMVLFLFVVMMLDIDVAKQRAGFVKYWPLAAICGLLVLGMLIWAVGPKYFGLASAPPPPALPLSFSNISVLGMALFTKYVYPFELAALLLLAAMIAAITLTFRGKRKGVKKQIPSRQIAVDPKTRLRVIDMPSSKGEAK